MLQKLMSGKRLCVKDGKLSLACSDREIVLVECKVLIQGCLVTLIWEL